MICSRSGLFFRASAATAAVAILFGAASRSEATLLVDGGFEDWPATTDLASWDEFGAFLPFGVEQETSIVLSGASSLELTQAGFDFPGVTQSFVVTPGQQLDASISAYRNAVADTSTTVVLRFEFDSGEEPASTLAFSALPAESWEPLSFSATVPTSATRAQFTVFLNHDFATNIDAGARPTVYFDDASVTAIPEPTTSALAVAALVALGVGRRTQAPDTL